MRKTFALILAVVVGLLAAPAAGANPNAVQWKETDVMGDPTVFAERAADGWIHQQYSRSGTFTAEAGDFTYYGTVEWTAAGKMKFDLSGLLPVFGTFRGQGTYVFEEGEGPMAGTTCQSTLQSKLVEDATRVPPFVFYGNQVAHCDNGAMIHGRIFGPTGPGSAPMGFEQTITGTLKT
jgi:hypothetical protein